MTIAQHISAIRNLTRQFGETEVPFTDEYLYHLFNASALRLVKQKFDKSYKTSDWNTKVFCISLEASTIHNCECLPSCTVLKSVNAIPRPLTSRSRDLLKVHTLDHRDIAYLDASTAYIYLLDEVRANKLSYSIIDDHVVLWNADTINIVPRAILVSGYFEDISAWSGITACDTNGDTTDSVCFDIFTEDYPLDNDLVDPAYRLVLELLRIPITLPDDRTNQQQQG